LGRLTPVSRRPLRNPFRALADEFAGDPGAPVAGEVAPGGCRNEVTTLRTEQCRSVKRDMLKAGRLGHPRTRRCSAVGYALPQSPRRWGRPPDPAPAGPPSSAGDA